MRSSIVCLLGLVLAAGRPSFAKEGLTVPQLLSLKQVREVVISPDGKHIAYTLLEPRSATDKPGGAYTSIWVLRFGEKAGRRFTLPTGEASSPGFTADGKRLTFLSKRGQSAQVFGIALDGGEAEAMTAAAGGILGYALSPDGAALAYRTLIPEDPARKEAAAKGRDERVVDKHHRHHQLRVLTLGSKADVAITSATQTAFDVAWSPDGKELAVMLGASPKNDDNYMFRSLWRYPASGGAGTLLVEKVGKMAKPSWSPDGKSIAWLGAEVKNDATMGTIWTIPAAGGAPKALNMGAEETVYDARWLPSGKLLVSAVRSTRSSLSVRSLDGAGGDAVGGPAFFGASVDKSGKRFALAGSLASHPGEVYTGSVGDAPKRATDHNPWLKDVALGAQETISWTARDGKRIDGVLVHPVGEKSGARAPLVQMVHGGPESQALDGWQSYYLQPVQVFAAKGYAVLLPNYRGSAGRGRAFATADHKDLGGKEFDDNVDAVTHLDQKGLVDPKRVGMLGGSYGGYMSALAATKGTAHFAAAMNFAGISNWTSFIGTSDIPYENSLVHWDLWCYDEPETCWKASPMAYIKQAKTPLLVMHGANDERVPISQAWEIYTAYRVQGIETELVIYPREGHGLRERAHQEDAMVRTLEFFGKHLGVK